jgi:hypothetical protein
MEARAVPNTYKVDAITADGWLTLACDDYDHYKSLPAALEFAGHRYEKRGWNSDFAIVRYSPGDNMVATGVKP